MLNHNDLEFTNFAAMGKKKSKKEAERDSESDSDNQEQQYMKIPN